ncbi:MAG: hypothetical protein ACRC6M_06395 [Microcystaceae cyanobacterium]
MGKKKGIKTLETTAITFDNLDNPEAIAPPDHSSISRQLMAMTAKEQENRQQIRLQLVNLELERQTKELGDRRLMQVLGFVMATIAVITGSLIVILNREIQGAIAGCSLGLTGIIVFGVLQIRLLSPLHKTVESPNQD